MCGSFWFFLLNFTKFQIRLNCACAVVSYLYTFLSFKDIFFLFLYQLVSVFLPTNFPPKIFVRGKISFSYCKNCVVWGFDIQQVPYPASSSHSVSLRENIVYVHEALCIQLLSLLLDLG